MLGIHMRELTPPELHPQFDDYLKGITENGQASGLLVVLTRSGERRVWEYRNTLRTEGVPEPIVRGMARDVTEQKRAEQLLRIANEDLQRKVREREITIRELKLFRTLVDRSNDSIQVMDPKTLCFLDANEKACEQLGYDREELLSLGIFYIEPKLTRSAAANITKELKRTGFVAMESVHRRKDGAIFPVELSLTRVELERGYTVVVARDLTERKKAEERLREYERVVQGLEERILVVDREYRYVIANRAFLHYRGLTREEVIGRTVAEVVGEETFDTIIKSKMDEAFEGRVVQYELRYKYPTMGERDMFASYFPIEGPSGIERISCILQDITDRKRSQEALRQSEERYRMFIAQSSEGIFREEMTPPISMDLPEDELVHSILYDACIAECNDAMAAMYGLTPGDLNGRRESELVPP